MESSQNIEHTELFLDVSRKVARFKNLKGQRDVFVKIVSDKGTVRAAFVKYSGSGDYLAMAKSDGYVELSIERQEFKKDDVVPFYRWGVN